MELLPFKSSQDFTIGMELEFQIINPINYNLMNRAKELMRLVEDTPYTTRITPEITQSMLEINSSVHESPNTMWTELLDIRDFLTTQANKVDINFCGGGTHPFQKWVSRKIFPSARYKQLSKKYKYLAKRSTVFGLHLHVGCSSAENAIYLAHIMARFVPQLIAMSAASPFYHGIDTGYHSSRVTIFNAFPTYGTIPYLTDWQEFSAYFNQMKNLGIIESMKDFYWDVRPKPEFGTVEVRVCDTPLTFRRSLLIAAYIQALAYYILREKALPISQQTYLLHSYNRFQAARYGVGGDFINPYSLKKSKIKEDIIETLKIIKPCAKLLGSLELLMELEGELVNKGGDAATLLEIFDDTGSMKAVVKEQCRLWKAY